MTRKHLTTKERLEPFDEYAAKYVADIMGPGSACAAAIAELVRRRAAGEDVALFITASGAQGANGWPAWQPASTAPSDGTRFLATVYGRKSPIIVYGRNDRFASDPGDYVYTVISWMPLPPIPSRATEAFSK